MIILVSSCALTKQKSDKITKTTSEVTKIIDTTTKTTVNKAIKDNVTTQVIRTEDPELDKKIDAILSRLNTTKSSGDNSYRFYYDAKLRELKAEFEVAKTQDSSSNTSSDIKIEKTFDQQVDEYIKKIVVPWWIYAIGIFLLIKLLLPSLKLLFPILNLLPTNQNTKPKT